MKYAIRLTSEAKRDIKEIAFYIARHDSPGKAVNLVKKLKTTIDGLNTSPERGAYPEELLLLDIREIREIHYGPYYNAKAYFINILPRKTRKNHGEIPCIISIRVPSVSSVAKSNFRLGRVLSDFLSYCQTSRPNSRCCRRPSGVAGIPREPGVSIVPPRRAARLKRKRNPGWYLDFLCRFR